MQPLDDIAPERAEHALARLAVHVPHDIDMPRMVAVKTNDTEHEEGVVFVAADGSFWFSHHGHAERFLPVDEIRAEVTEWGWRMERSRNVVHVDPTE